MARFRFRLQPVLDHRGRIVDERQRELGQKQRELAQATAHGAGLDADRETRRAALTRDHAKMAGDTLRATYAHLAFLDRTIDDHAVRIAACQAEFERAQTRLLEADMDRKVLETLKSRRLETFNAAEAQAEQRDVDDQNARRYGREHRRGADE